MTPERLGGLISTGLGHLVHECIASGKPGQWLGAANDLLLAVREMACD